MKLSQLAIISALFVAAFARTDDPEIKVRFYKFDDKWCAGPHNDNKDISHEECKNFDYKFASYYYLAHGPSVFSNDEDFDDQRCAVVVYEKPDCEGISQCLGSFPATEGECGQTQAFMGRSARVQCDDTCQFADIYYG